MTNVFAVVGEHRTEPDRLLLLGDDGRYYAYVADAELSVVEPTESWCLDDEEPGDWSREPEGVRR